MPLQRLQFRFRLDHLGLGQHQARGSSKKGSARATPAKAAKANSNGNGANLGFEAQLFLAADKLRKNLEPSDYKHVCLGLIFLKHISNAFEAKRAALLAEDAAAAEDPDEYLAENVFWVPKEARWSHLQANAKQPTIGKLIDEAMAEIEKANPGLKGVLPKDYNRPALDKVMLGELIDLVSGIGMGEPGDKAKDILGHAPSKSRERTPQWRSVLRLRSRPTCPADLISGGHHCYCLRPSPDGCIRASVHP